MVKSYTCMAGRDDRRGIRPFRASYFLPGDRSDENNYTEKNIINFVLLLLLLYSLVGKTLYHRKKKKRNVLQLYYVVYFFFFFLLTLFIM